MSYPDGTDLKGVSCKTCKGLMKSKKNGKGRCVRCGREQGTCCCRKEVGQ